MKSETIRKNIENYTKNNGKINAYIVRNRYEWMFVLDLFSKNNIIDFYTKLSYSNTFKSIDSETFIIYEKSIHWLNDKNSIGYDYLEIFEKDKYNIKQFYNLIETKNLIRLEKLNEIYKKNIEN